MEIVKESALNPYIFNGYKLKTEVRKRIIEIVEEFCSRINENLNFEILDIVLVGSNASYNYTDSSDLDVHIIVDLSRICKECPEIVQYLFDSEKSRFNLNYDISIKGIEVEIYVEDVRSGTVSNGIYSVAEDRWVKFPENNSDQIERKEPPEEYYNIIEIVDRALCTLDSSVINEVINLLYLIRKRGLESEGESSDGNWIFKKIRSLGKLDQLKSKYFEVRSNELTLEGLTSTS